MLGLENRWPVSTGSGVRIPPSPLTMRDSAQAAGIRAEAPKPAAMRNTPIHTANAGTWRWVTRSRLAHGCLVTAAGVALGFMPMTASAATTTKPCAKHTRYTAVTKSECLAAHRKQARRDRMAFPPRPTWTEALDRLNAYEERSLLAIGRCEMGTRSPGYKKAKRGFPPASSPWARLRWGLDYSRYSTAFGIWNGNGAYIRRATGGYAFPGRTPAEELLGAKALADGPARGFSGWACHGRS